MEKRLDEVPPPWVESPGYPPADIFWRQSGQYWFAYVWEPFWNTLNVDEKEDYLKRWNVPDVWRMYSIQINSEFAKWLESTDNES